MLEWSSPYILYIQIKFSRISFNRNTVFNKINETVVEYKTRDSKCKNAFENNALTEERIAGKEEGLCSLVRLL